VGELILLWILNAESHLLDALLRCGSGKELVGRGLKEDVRLASELNVSNAAPLLVDGAYTGI
jgi:phosphosulfolactate phosphohydrolase-like enzyme